MFTPSMKLESHVRTHAHTPHALILMLVFNPITDSSPATQVAKHLYTRAHVRKRAQLNKLISEVL